MGVTPEELSFAHWKLERYEIDGVKEALRQADSGRLIPHLTVKQMFASRYTPDLLHAPTDVSSGAKLSWADAIMNHLRTICRSVGQWEMPAERYLGEVFSIVEMIGKRPDIGRPGRVHGTREWDRGMDITTVVYRERFGGIEVLGLLVSHRKWPYMKTGRV
jgi:plasmid stabilization system protein ParE